MVFLSGLNMDGQGCFPARVLSHLRSRFALCFVKDDFNLTPRTLICSPCDLTHNPVDDRRWVRVIITSSHSSDFQQQLLVRWRCGNFCVVKNNFTVSLSITSSVFLCRITSYESSPSVLSLFPPELSRHVHTCQPWDSRHGQDVLYKAWV